MFTSARQHWFLSPQFPALFLKLLPILMVCLLVPPVHAQTADPEPTIVKIPYMDRPGPHREYSDRLLKVALELSEEAFGPYVIAQQPEQTVIRRNLLELETGNNLSVATSMPTPEWLNRAQVVQFPIMRGMASYRMFFARQSDLDKLNEVDSLEALKAYTVGQGPGWSTGKILEDNGFEVVYGGPYDTLLPMLTAGRFQLLMRGVYEIVPELDTYESVLPDLGVVEGFAVFTYLPMYFFVSKQQPELAERLQYGLEKAHASGDLDELFEQYFGEMMELLDLQTRKIFTLPNTNIDSSYFEQDSPYLLDPVKELGQALRP